MANTPVISPAPGKRRGWLRGVAWALGIIVVLVVVTYFVATSSAFLKGVILPRVSTSLNAKITVGDASVSPFSQVVLRDLKVQTTGREPLITAPEVRLRYSLMDIIRGNIVVHEMTLALPGVTLIENPDGSSNLDPILKAQGQQPSTPASPLPSKPMQIDVKKITLSNGTIRQIKLHADGKRDLTELSNLNLEISDVKNGQTGKLTLGADIKIESNPPAPGTNDLLQAKLNANFSFGLSATLKPGSIQGNTRLEVTRAEGGLAQATGFGLNLDCQVDPAEIKQVALVLQKGGSRLGQLLVSGPFDMEKLEGRLVVQLLGVDKNLLNIATTGTGLDFGGTAINSTNLIVLAKGGQSITVGGQFSLNSFQVTRANQTTPPLDLRARYDVGVDRAASNVLVRAFDLAGTQMGNQFLRGELTSPMAIGLGGTSSAVGDSALSVIVSRLDLANWKALLGDAASAGEVNMKLQLLSKQAGMQLSFDLDSEVVNLAAGSGSNQITGATVTLRVRGQAVDLKQFNLPEYRLQVSRQGDPLLSVTGSGVYDLGNETADLRLGGEMVLARLLQLAPQPDANISSGTAKFSARVVQKQKLQTVTGSFALSDLNGRFGSNSFRNFGTAVEFDLGMTPQQVQIRKLAGTLSEGPNPGGAFDLSGTYDLTNSAAKLNARLANFNQAGLRTFLEPMLTGKQLVSVALNGSAAVDYDPIGASSVKADLQVTNLVVKDPQGQFPATPLEARMQVDASLNKQVAEVRQFAIGLTPTQRATNRVQLTGRVDLTQTTNIQGNLKLTADALDLTRYYELFAGKDAASPGRAAPATPPPVQSPAPTAPETEPEPSRLPFTNFVAEATIGRIFLHEVAISNLQTTFKIDGGRILLAPCKLSLNGAPVSAAVDLDLGVRGYKYEVTASAQAIPLAPLVNSFQPERKGRVGGTLSADAKIAGVGTTGASLQKNLAGHFDIGTTNLNLAVSQVRSPLLKSLISVVVMLPDLAKNPESAVTSLLGSLVSKPGPGTASGLSSDLEKSPIDQILLRGSLGAGKVQLQQAFVQSPAFQAQASGTLQIQPVLTNSTIEIPVSLTLSQPVARRIKMVPENTPTNQAYVKLPDFLTMRGTVGQPKRDINKLALLGAVYQGVSGRGTGGSSQTGNLIQGLLGGGNSTNTSAAGTTNRSTSGVGGLLQGILSGKPPAATNAVPGSTTNRPATNQTPIGNLLDGLLGPKKK